MAIRGKEEDKKNGMKITDNMDGEKKLMKNYKLNMSQEVMLVILNMKFIKKHLEKIELKTFFLMNQ